ncbi:hypothetical protein ACFL5O_12105, partial [Myxococcota bacterium]
MAETEQAAEPRSTPDGASDRVVVTRKRRRPDELTAEPLVKAFGQIVIHESTDPVPQLTLTEDDEVLQTLRPNPAEPEPNREAGLRASG